MSRPRIGLALGSGSARGWSHIGVIQALGEAGIEPDIVCGSSIGALVGAAYVAGELEALEKWAREISWRQIVRFLDVSLSSGGLIEGRRIMSFFSELHEDTTIESLSRPFVAVAADLVSGREIWLREGSVTEAVRASIALPGILSPVRKDDWCLIDGGVVNPVPVSACRALGAEVIIAVNLNSDLVGRHGIPKRLAEGEGRAREPEPDFLARLSGDLPAGIRNSVNALATQLLGARAVGPGYFDVIAGAINIMQDQITRSRLAGEPPHVMLMPRLSEIGLLEFDRADETIAEGRRSVEQMLPVLRELVP
jgi:NTE family protein